MPITRCPECGAQVRIEDEDLGYDVECPTCRAVFKARAGEDAPPRRRVDDPDDTFAPRDEPDDRPSRRRPVDDEDDRPSRRRPVDDEDDFDDRPRRRRRRRYDDDLSDEEVVDEARRAVFLPALFTIILCVIGMGLAALEIVMMLTMPGQVRQGNPFAPPPWMTDEILILIRVAAIIWEGLILAGSVSMMRLRSFRFAQVVMVMRVIPFAGCCCILGLPFGIWGMTVLNRPEIREGFELAAKGVEARPRDDDFDDR